MFSAGANPSTGWFRNSGTRIREQRGNINSSLPFLDVLLRSLACPQLLEFPDQGALSRQRPAVLQTAASRTFSQTRYDRGHLEHSSTRPRLSAPCLEGASLPDTDRKSSSAAKTLPILEQVFKGQDNSYGLAIDFPNHEHGVEIVLNKPTNTPANEQSHNCHSDNTDTSSASLFSISCVESTNPVRQ